MDGSTLSILSASDGMQYIHPSIGETTPPRYLYLSSSLCWPPTNGLPEGPGIVDTTSPDGEGEIRKTLSEFEGMPQTWPSAVVQPPCHFQPPSGKSPMTSTLSSGKPILNTPGAQAGMP